MKPGSKVIVIYTGKEGTVLSSHGDTVVIKQGDRQIYLKKTEVKAL